MVTVSKYSKCFLQHGENQKTPKRGSLRGFGTKHLINDTLTRT